MTLKFPCTISYLYMIKIENFESTKLISSDQSNLLRHSLRKLFQNKKVNKILLINPPDGDYEIFNFEVAKTKRYTNFAPYGLGIISKHLNLDERRRPISFLEVRGRVNWIPIYRCSQKGLFWVPRDSYTCLLGTQTPRDPICLVWSTQIGNTFIKIG